MTDELLLTLAAKDAIIREQADRLALYESTLEAERQWRLKSLPALLAAEAKAARCVCQREDVQSAPEVTEIDLRGLVDRHTGKPYFTGKTPPPDLSVSSWNRP